MEFKDEEDLNSFHNMKDLGEPTSIEKFEQGGVVYELKVWQTPTGAIKMVDIIDIASPPNDIDFKAIKEEVTIDKDDLNSVFGNTGAIPMGFLRLLGEAAKLDENHREHFKALTPLVEITLGEQIEDLEEDLEIAVSHEDYEGAAEIKKELELLKQEV